MPQVIKVLKPSQDIAPPQSEAGVGSIPAPGSALALPCKIRFPSREWDGVRYVPRTGEVILWSKCDGHFLISYKGSDTPRIEYEEIVNRWIQSAQNAASERQPT